MALSDERQQVLRMIDEGKITAEEGVKLIDALSDGGESWLNDRSEIAEPVDKEAQVQITVTQADGQGAKVILPLLLARVALPLFDLPQAALLGEFGVDMNRVREALRTGEPGDVLDYEDEHSGHRVHIAIV